jgi:hypothetical protein
MRTASVFTLVSISIALFSAGCAEETSREHIVSHLTASESQVFPDHAVWMGDRGGYHYIHVRNIYCLLGDKDYVVPVATWDLPDPFPFTDDASKWRNVQWEDKDALLRSRFAYVLLDPREQVASPSVRTDSQPTQPATDIAPSATQQIEPTTITAPSATQQNAPTTQPASQP